MKASWFLSPFLLSALAGCSAATDGTPRTGSPAEPAPVASAGTTAVSRDAGSSPGTSNDNPATGLIEAGAAIGGNDASPEPAKCGEHHFDLERKPAELLLVLDRSASMKDAASGATNEIPKWDLVVPAVNEDLDGQMLVSGSDSAVSMGGIGAGTSDCTAEFDDVVVNGS